LIIFETGFDRNRKTTWVIFKLIERFEGPELIKEVKVDSETGAC
jgi:hypothetical protein